MRKLTLSILPILFVLSAVSGAFATGTTTYGLSGAIMTYYAYTLGNMEIAPQAGVDFWAAPYVTPPLAADDCHHGHLYYIAPGGFTLSFFNRFEVAAMVTASGIEARKFVDRNPYAPWHEKILSEGGLGDTHVGIKGQFLNEEQAKIDMAAVVFIDIPTGKQEFTLEHEELPNDPLYRKELKFLTQGDGNYNIGFMGVISKKLMPKEFGAFTMFNLHNNIGYVVRTGTAPYADNISLYRFDWEAPADMSHLVGHVHDSNRSNYFLLGGAMEFTPWRYLTAIFDTQFRLYQSVDSDAVLHPNGNAAKQTQVMLGVRFNAQDFFHVTLAFGKTFGKWAIDYTTGSLSDKNYNAQIILSADVPIIPLDRDGDGIPDKRDLCPTDPEDFDGFQDEDGCPDWDNDNDGIKDVIDGAPNDPEDFDGWEDTDGIPDLDNDGDGIPDTIDKCPNEPETFNGYMDDDGCPDEVPVEVKMPEKKLIIMTDIKFKPDKAEMLPGQYDSLAEAGMILKDYPDITVTISGHAASTGRFDFEMQLSKDRAQTIKNYLVTKYGIDSSKIDTQGFGSTMPLGDNSTEYGRAMNRRIEFTVNEM